MRSSLPCAFLALLAFMLSASADAQEKARRFCDEADPANKCPGADCRCVPDTLEVTFDGRSASVLHAGDLEPGATITVTVVTDTRSDFVTGWSYGVAHDQSVLRVLSATMKGTDAFVTRRGGFDATSIEKIEECVDDDPRCATFRDGGGWISATVLNLVEPPELPIRRNSLAIAEYTLLERPGAEGTVIRLTDRLKKVGSPPVAINWTIAGKTRVPTTLVDGFISARSLPAQGSFLRGDASGDGRLTVIDAVQSIRAVTSREELACEDAHDADDSGNIDFIDGLILLRFLFDRGPPGSIGICGRDLTNDALGCSTSCSG